MEKQIIRKIEPNDWEVFKAMSQEFYAIDYINLCYSESNLANTFELCLKENPFVEGFIFQHSNQIAGFALTCLSWSNEVGGKVLWIDELFVLPKFRGRGISSEFLRFLDTAFAADIKRLFLEVSDKNNVASQFYSSRGFRPLGNAIMKKDAPLD